MFSRSELMSVEMKAMNSFLVSPFSVVRGYDSLHGSCIISILNLLILGAGDFIFNHFVYMRIYRIILLPFFHKHEKQILVC